jgi:hypothetical protein
MAYESYGGRQSFKDRAVVFVAVDSGLILGVSGF